MSTTGSASDVTPGLLERIRTYALVGGEKVVRIPVGIAITGLTSRALGVEDFGLFCTVMVVVTLLTPLASFGLESLGIALATRSSSASAYLRGIAPFRFATGVAAALVFLVAVTVLFGSRIDGAMRMALYVLSGIFVLRIGEIGENVLFSQGRYTSLAMLRGIAFLGASAVIAVALLNRPSLSLLLALNAVEAAFLLLAYVVILRADVRAAVSASPLSKAQWSVRAQLRSSLPVFASGVLVLLLLNVDKLLVYRFLGEAQAGLYGSAAKLVDVLYFIPMVIGTVHAASLTRLAGQDGFEAAVRSAFLTATGASLLAALVLAMFSGIIVQVVFGSPFAGAASTLALLAPGLVAVTWVSLRTRALAAMDERLEIFRLTVIASVIHIPVLAVGIRIGTIEAVAACQSLGWLLAATLVPLVSRRAAGLSPVRLLWNHR